MKFSWLLECFASCELFSETVVFSDISKASFGVDVHQLKHPPHKHSCHRQFQSPHIAVPRTVTTIATVVGTPSHCNSSCSHPNGGVFHTPAKLSKHTTDTICKHNNHIRCKSLAYNNGVWQALFDALNTVRRQFVVVWVTSLLTDL
jgi:hypothetical protein